MRYIFLDTESSNCFSFVHKLCEYGFITTDEDFKELPDGRQDVLVNPGNSRGSRFHLPVRKNRKGFALAHTEEEYRASPTFDHFYEDLKSLLSQEDIMIFFWAGENDIETILDNCNRFNLPRFSFVSYDVQMLYMSVINSDKTPSLSKAMGELELSFEGIVAHKPDDDSMMTCMVLKALCEKAGKTLPELLKECPQCEMESISTFIALKAKHQSIMDRKGGKKARKQACFDALNQLQRKDVLMWPAWEKSFCVSCEIRNHIIDTLSNIKKWVEHGFIINRKMKVRYLVYYNEGEREKLLADLKVLKYLQPKLVSIHEFNAIALG